MHQALYGRRRPRRGRHADPRRRSRQGWRHRSRGGRKERAVRPGEPDEEGQSVVTRVIAVIVTSVSIATLFAQPRGRDWPAVARETKPWTRWWWQGSAVDPASLTVNLQSIAGAGIGGVEITPI